MEPDQPQKVWKFGRKEKRKFRFCSLKGTAGHLTYLFFVLLCVGIGSITSQSMAVKLHNLAYSVVSITLFTARHVKQKLESTESSLSKYPWLLKARLLEKALSLLCFALTHDHTPLSVDAPSSTTDEGKKRLKFKKQDLNVEIKIRFCRGI